MPVTVETERVVKSRKYVCDVLFKEVAGEEVHATYNQVFIISEEARRLLPLAVQRDEELVRLVTLGCGQERHGFHPSMLLRGFWVIARPPQDSGRPVGYLTKGPYNVPDEMLSADHGTNPQAKSKFSRPDAFESLSEVLAWIDRYRARDGWSIWILQDGEVVRQYHTVVQMVAVDSIEPIDHSPYTCNLGPRR
jgi:hypothetical protein